MAIMHEKYVLILKFSMCCEDNSPGISNFSACYVNGRAEIEKKHSIKRDWPAQVSRTPGQKDITNSALVEPSNIILPSLYI